MAQKSERVKLLEEGFMEKRSKGLSISEIAQVFGVTPRTVYNSLETIAKKWGVSRESLLDVVHKTHNFQKNDDVLKTTSTYIVDKEALKAELKELLGEVNNLISKINKTLKKENA